MEGPRYPGHAARFASLALAQDLWHKGRANSRMSCAGMLFAGLDLTSPVVFVFLFLVHSCAIQYTGRRCGDLTDLALFCAAIHQSTNHS